MRIQMEELENIYLNLQANNWNSIPRISLNYQTANEIIEKATGFKNLLPVD